ncbi:MAG TPA: MG2 domain-containing protein [Kofleriaceae bacterium]|nr:MG2 domain-containing protein [Kofleriaceae bacterium]
MNKKVWIAITALVWIVSLFASEDRCARTWFSYGIDIESCPDGAFRQSAQLEATGLRRNAPGWVSLRPIAHYTTDGADRELRALVPRVSAVELWLTPKRDARDAREARWPLAADWDSLDDGASGQVTLPDVPDGDYQLHASYQTRLGRGEVALPLALYTPARIHVLTDRPLYEPGNTVRFRAVVLRARDLAPLDHRPGVWVVQGPDGDVLLEEAAPAGDWGVVAGSFPLDKAAPTGTWKVAWRSGDAADEVPFTVEPFTLPRFRVDALAAKPFYQAGDRPVIKGAVIYSSGAPVAGATLEITWDVNGAWPPPTDWQTTGLPKRAQTSPSGRFELALPQVPADLQGMVTLAARISAVDGAGDRVEGAAQVLLSQDAIQVSAVTELGDGLVESFNNRLYLRVTTPDGRVVPGAKVTVKRAWQPGDRGVEAALDEDGVASLQIDPGAPVNIVVPAPPWRPAPRPALVSRGEPRELIGGEGASLADQVAFDRWLAPLATCARWVDADGADGDVRLSLRVTAGGSVTAASAGPSALERCAAAVALGQRLPGGPERLYALELHFVDPGLPRLTASIDSTFDAPPGLDDRLGELAKAARDCLPAVEGELASVLSWRVRAGKKDVELTGWVDRRVTDGTDGGRAALPCVMSRIDRGAKLQLAEDAPSDAMGLVRFTVERSEAEASERPQPTTMLGYELEVIADVEGKPHTRLRVPPGTVPELRMRVTPVLARPGDTVTAQLIRGPQFTGQLPDKLALDCLEQHVEGKLDGEHRAQLAIEAKTSGWCTVSGGGVRAQVYVRPAADLAVSVVPRKDRYRPGEKAELAIQTLLGGKGGKAAVGLFGVDDSLAQLVPLPGPDALGRLRPKVETSAPAFGVLDGQALALGQIRGANAAAATVLRVSQVPTAPEVDAVVGGRAESAFDPIEELTDRFYVVLAELHVQVRAWEARAPASEKMTPATMARLWGAALDACAARGERVDDAYGRRLRLSRLPADLLSLIDPRAVVVMATRLTEDVENWPAWVARERP